MKSYYLIPPSPRLLSFSSLLLPISLITWHHSPYAFFFFLTFVTDFILQLLADHECDFARLTNRPILVFLFGHGHEATRGVHLGDAKVTIPDFLEAIGEDVSVTVISTACFSGGWAVHPLLNITASTAAGPDELSESWPASGSVGRNCGSIYATALIQSLGECCTADNTEDEIETYIQ
jgi:hypothetical protein